MRTAIPFAVGLVALAGLLPAQRVDLPRERAFGIARAADGAPWSGATVELLARPIGDDETVGVADHLTTTTDDRGRFAAEILTGLRYTVWAWRADGEGGYRTSDVVDDVVPRQPILLTRSGETRTFARGELGVEDGVALPVRVFARARTTNVHVVELVPGPDGAFALPALPPVPVDVEVFDADGVPLVSRRVDPTGHGSWTIAVPARVPVRVLVRDIDSEAAPPAAFVAVQWGARLLRVGDLGADGCGEIALPAGAQPIAFATSRAGAGIVARPEPDERRNGEAWPSLREGFEDQRHAHVGPGVTIRGRLLIGPDVPAAGAWLALSEYTMHYTERNSRSLDRVRRSFQTDADGRFEIPHVLEEFPPSIALVLAPAHLAALPESWRAGFGPVVPSVVDLERMDALRDDAIHDLGDLDVLRLVPTRVTILAPDGAPAMAASLVLEGLGQSSISVTLPTRWVADRSGGLPLLLPAGRSWCATVRATDGPIDLFTLSTDDGARVSDPVNLPFTMRPPLWITGRVVDPAGTAVEGLGLQVQPLGAERLHEPATPAARRDGPVVLDPQVDARTFARIARTTVLAGGAIRTDADGCFRIAVPSIPMRYRLTLKGVRVDVDVDGDDDPEPVEVEVPR